MEDTREQLLARLFETLEAEEEMLLTLIDLARRQQQALVENAFTSLGMVNEQMVAVAEELAPFELERERLTKQLGVATVSDAAALAANAGLYGFAALRERLLAAAATFRDLQESNAALVLNAVKLNERWFNLVAGMVAPTYAAGGKPERQSQRPLIQKSA